MFAARLHSLQILFAMRGLSLLKVGGGMVYSTCSMNPIENEAVVAEVLQRCGESVKLLDVSSELPQLIRRTGLKIWESIFELIEAIVDKPPSVLVACTRSEAIKSLLTTSANGALILRVLQALSSFVTSSTEKENDGISRAHFEFSEINSVLEPLWHELSCCISKIESYSEPASEISTPFISIRSAQFIVISTSIHTFSLQASNNTYHIQVNSQQ
ncbi:hypothetical protein KIW84_070131 [Lathyrus oleraceus]|uniref:SAM-dependent MTase RsmB/NOP-type domain-containing protein n=1 Tax=Pisum sativum TaxID=3888 RepID=A0A9D4VF67_PEA|nr:hypothetical protein KIW84_070128 [Pisum sativum]KAI5382572.1 hypothetical protein KIW84_070131 [Pisum sativum]